MATGSRCTIHHLGTNTLQGDSDVAEKVLKPMGCAVEVKDDSISVLVPTDGKLSGLG